MMWNSYRGPEAKKIEQRLRALSASADTSERAAVLKNRMLSEVPAVDRLLMAIPRIHRLDRFLLQSGLNWTVAKLLMMSVVSAGVAFVALSFVSVLPLLQLGVMLGAALVPFAYVQWKRRRRLQPSGAATARYARLDRPGAARGPRAAFRLADGG